MLVVDASALFLALADDFELGERVRDRLSTEQLASPSLIDIEVTSVLRRHVGAGLITRRRAALSLTDLLDLPLLRTSTHRTVPRCWELRDNLTAYDASYVALAETYDCPLITSDRRLAGAPGIRCAVEVVD